MPREKTYACRECWDTGFAYVIALDVARDLRAALHEPETFDLKGRNPSAVARCTCSKGRGLGQAIPERTYAMVPLPVLLGTPEEKRQQLFAAFAEYSAPKEFSQQFT